MVRRALHHLHDLALIGRQRTVTEQLHHANDSVQRRADLVAHGRQEVRLGLRGSTRFVACAAKFKLRHYLSAESD